MARVAVLSLAVWLGIPLVPAPLLVNRTGMSQVVLARRSVLDGVMGQISALETRVGRADRARLEQHFDSVRTLELRLSTAPSVCTTPADPGEFPDVSGNEQIEQQNRAMSDLCAVALACDLTRAFSMFFSTAGSGVIMWPIGATNSLHQINHDEAAPYPTVHAATTYTMAQLAYTEATTRGCAPERKAQLSKQLVAYCKLDTLAMVELARALVE